MHSPSDVLAVQVASITPQAFNFYDGVWKFELTHGSRIAPHAPSRESGY